MQYNTTQHSVAPAIRRKATRASEKKQSAPDLSPPSSLQRHGMARRGGPSTAVFGSPEGTDIRLMFVGGTSILIGCREKRQFGRDRRCTIIALAWAPGMVVRAGESRGDARGDAGPPRARRRPEALKREAGACLTDFKDWHTCPTQVAARMV